MCRWHSTGCTRSSCGSSYGAVGVVELVRCADGIVLGVLEVAAGLVELVTCADGIVLGTLEVVTVAVGIVESVMCADGIVLSVLLIAEVVNAEGVELE